jgi:hypothetical protein
MRAYDWGVVLRFCSLPVCRSDSRVRRVRGFSTGLLQGCTEGCTPGRYLHVIGKIQPMWYFPVEFYRGYRPHLNLKDDISGDFRRLGGTTDDMENNR